MDPDRPVAPEFERTCRPIAEPRERAVDAERMAAADRRQAEMLREYMREYLRGLPHSGPVAGRCA
jgi:hypothetical protein